MLSSPDIIHKRSKYINSVEQSDKQSRIHKLREQVVQCRRCSLYKTRTNSVLGEGDVDAKIMFIGEAPGRNEDLQGKPFVGRAGDVFDQLLQSVDLTRQQIYLCNILKCRPPSNRNPLPKEIEACVGSLDVQMKIIHPKIVVTLGSFATQYIFNKFTIPFTKISDLNGKIFNAHGPAGSVKIIALFHPAVATYNPSKLKILMSDFKIIKQHLNS